MTITLKRALRLRGDLEKALALPIQAKTSFSLITNSIEDFGAAVKKNTEAFLEKVQLSAILQELRQKITQENARSTDAILCEIGHVQRLIGFYTQLASMEGTTIKAVTAEIDYYKERLGKEKEDSLYGRGPATSITLSLISQDQVENAKRELKALKNRLIELEDRRNAANVYSHIVLGKESETFLKERGFL